MPYARAVEGLRLLEELLAYPERTCMPNVLIHADAGMGKTMLAAKFRRDHPPSFDTASGVTTTPVIFVEMPPAPDEGRFYTRLLDSIVAPGRAAGDAGARRPWRCASCPSSGRGC